jgi:AraC family transcriptional regulator of adaptative response/methylated-DNA-[protein]-cysteine methyltransferase
MYAEQTTDYQRIAAAIAYLEEHHQEQPSLDELAAHLGLSPYHLQRIFTRWAGISPKRFLQYLTVEHAKGLLAEFHNLLDVTYETGLSSPGRLHDLFVTVEAMTPGEFKQGGTGLDIVYGVHDTPFGSCLLAITARGVCGLSFLNGGGLDAELAALQARWPHARLALGPAETAPVVERVFGDPGLAETRPISLLLSGTNFQIRVWDALLRLLPGNVCTYEDVAHAIGQPSAARAVGAAVGANHVAYLIPCHRVIRKSGAIQDYRWGATRKKAMLGWEAARRESCVG